MEQLYKRTCALCGEKEAETGNKDGHCAKCALSLESIHKDVGARAGKYAASQKCKRCGKGLPLSRYFFCTDCQGKLPEDDLQLWEAQLWSGEYHGNLYIPPVKKGEGKPRHIRTSKTCNRCSSALPISEFGPNLNNADGHCGHCKACDRAYHSLYYRRSRARKQEAA